MTIAIGNTIYWTSGGVSYSGVVTQTPTELASGLENDEGGEPFYVVDNVSPTGGRVTSTTEVPVRAAEVSLSA